MEINQATAKLMTANALAWRLSNRVNSTMNNGNVLYRAPTSMFVKANSEKTVENVSRKPLIIPVSIFGAITAPKVVHHPAPKLAAASLSVLTSILSNAFATGRYMYGKHITMSPHTRIRGELMSGIQLTFE